jgi:hypothetical protein
MIEEKERYLAAAQETSFVGSQGESPGYCYLEIFVRFDHVCLL